MRSAELDFQSSDICILVGVRHVGKKKSRAAHLFLVANYELNHKSRETTFSTFASPK